MTPARSGRFGLALALIVAMATLLTPTAVPAATEPATTGPPVAVFADLDGTWRGTFVGYGSDGRELYRIEVEQVYRTVDDTTQTVALTDRMADGTVITGRGRNIARRLPDGSLELLCIVEKSNGDKVEHQGRLVRDPQGRSQILWFSDGDGRTEMFRESVTQHGADRLYSIDGTGRYGDTLVLMAGRYWQLAKETPKER